jgi:cysteinyl-tRNA synthetase
VFHILNCFGLYEANQTQNEGGSEKVLTELMNALTKYRDQVKNLAGTENAAKDLFRISDELRDDILPYLGIRLEDKGKG